MNIPSHNAKTLESQLRKILNGIEKNLSDWPKNDQLSKAVFLKTSEELQEQIKEIKKCEKKLSAERKKLQEYITMHAKPLYKKARDQAYSIYGKSSEKLTEYNLKKI